MICKSIMPVIWGKSSYSSTSPSLSTVTRILPGTCPVYPFYFGRKAGWSFGEATHVRRCTDGTSWKHHALVINCAIVPHLCRFGGIPFFPAGGALVIAKIFKEPFRGNITIAGVKINGVLRIGSENFVFRYPGKFRQRSPVRAGATYEPQRRVTLSALCKGDYISCIM